AVAKSAQAQLEPDAALGDRVNQVFQGTEVLQGRAAVLVTETAMATQLGKIAALLQGVESEPTPLQRRMSQLGNTLVTGSLALVALVVVGGVIQSGWSAFESLLEVSLSMAVAVVPEGLPAVITVTLAIGTQRMVRRQALIRKLPAVETLGSVTTICSDKTGTLTQNKMVVQQVHTQSLNCQVTGEGYIPEGDFYSPESDAEQTTIDATHPELQLLLLTGLLCNDAVLQKEAGEWIILGDPTEGALLTLAGKGGLLQAQMHSDRAFPRIAEFPFDSDRKRMGIVVQWSTSESERDRPPTLTNLPLNSKAVLFAKGSPEGLLKRCTNYQQHSEPIALDDAARSQILNHNEQLASQGLRVLGLAYRLLDMPDDGSIDSSAEAIEQDLTWLGLVGMRDAPRPEVRQAVARCRQAGIRPVMITGDHQLTAIALAKDLGIAAEKAQALSGQALETMPQSELEAAVSQVSVYARVSPEHKLRIVQALQAQQQIAAMTGDGVNDAPALKQADIGIAMGITGTDVSKEASDMVLLDDNFATIVAATEEGRVVYDNIRRFVKYILGSNIGEVLTIAASPILLPILDVPLTPLQILWMNLVTDGFPALALALEPAEPNVMNRPPYHPQESIFARGLGAYMIRIGIVFTVITVTLMYWAYHQAQISGDPDRWKTMVFTTLCLAQMGHAIAVRSNTRLTIEISPLSNPYVLLAVTVTTALQLMLVYIEPLRNFFGTHLLSPQELAVCFGFSTLMFVWVESEKIFRRWRQNQ
ncbi:MAG: cation-transporting P-type ATPase, partial [Cyanobacteria bacterium P01_C01_bin.73]